MASVSAQMRVTAEPRPESSLATWIDRGSAIGGNGNEIARTFIGDGFDALKIF